MSTSTNKLRVVSYNVLSSKLARPSHFTMTNPDHLEATYRLPLILSKLEHEMGRAFAPGDDSDSVEKQPLPPPTIFCLQEIDYTFTSALHTFFANKGYAFVTGLYGKKFNGYMGVGVAYPLKEFETLKVDICRLSDEKEGGWPRPPDEDEEKGVISKVSRGVIKKLKTLAAFTFKSTAGLLLNYIGSPNESTIDAWDMTENRFNVLLTVALKFRENQAMFSISNYHMPCAFYCPPVMNLHVDMAARRAQQLASEIHNDVYGTDAVGEVPHILAGDFNILPDSAHYKLVTTGVLEESDPSYPPLKHGFKWKSTCEAMDSAYATHSGAEPSFTNYAHLNSEDEPFIGTLDYIFLSRKEHNDRSSCKWVVRDVVKLPEKEASGGPFPNECEPSDHLLISADLKLE